MLRKQRIDLRLLLSLAALVLAAGVLAVLTTGGISAKNAARNALLAAR